MNSNELNIELERNKSDKQLLAAELEGSKKKWIEYIMKSQDEICSNPRPLLVRKKFSSKWADFIKRLKTIFGFKERKDNRDGIEAYISYSDDIKSIV